MLRRLNYVIHGYLAVAAPPQAIWEEVEAARSSGKTAKQYVMMQLVTPENPTYLHHMAERSWEMDFDVPTMCGELMNAYTACIMSWRVLLISGETLSTVTNIVLHRCL